MERKQINRIFRDACGMNLTGFAHFIFGGREANECIAGKLIPDYGQKLSFPTNEVGEMLLPFPQCLIEFRFDDGDQWCAVTTLRGVVIVSMITCCGAEDDGKHYLVTAIAFRVIGNNLPIERVQSGVGAFRWTDNNLQILGKGEQRAIMEDGWTERTLSYLRAFIEIVNHPGHSVVQRFPKEKLHDINWIRSRAHYLIIDNNESKTIAHSGATRTFDGTITRAMHARRAHFRTLKHERFKQNIGKIIWVHACWVGPKEWEGIDEKVYRVVASSNPTILST